MEWKRVFLESSEKRVNNKITKPKMVLKGIGKHKENLYYLEYVDMSGLKWWAATQIENPDLDRELLKTLPLNIFYNKDTQEFYDFQELPENIKINLSIQTEIEE